MASRDMLLLPDSGVPRTFPRHLLSNLPLRLSGVSGRSKASPHNSGASPTVPCPRKVSKVASSGASSSTEPLPNKDNNSGGSSRVCKATSGGSMPATPVSPRSRGNPHSNGASNRSKASPRSNGASNHSKASPHNSGANIPMVPRPSRASSGSLRSKADSPINRASSRIPGDSRDLPSNNELDLDR